MKPNREPRPAEAVIADVQRHLPELAEHCHLDRAWLWYCGPSLAGDQNKPTRETLSQLGFRFAPRGHPMMDGQTGSWSHSCDRPLRRIKRGHNSQSTDQQQPDHANAIESILAGCDV